MEAVFVVVLFMLFVVLLASVVMAHVALPEMRRGNTLFVGDGDGGGGTARTGRVGRMTSKLRVPADWSRPQPGPRHAR